MNFNRYYKYAIVLACILSTALNSLAQNSEFGLYLGGSYYMGELNPRKHFADVTSPAIGIYQDAHINSRYTWRTIGTFGKLKANDNLTDIGLNNYRGLQFETDIYELSGQIHFNFLPYGFMITEKPFTPYLFIGLSIFHVNPHVSSMNSDTISTALPKEDYTRTLTSVSVPFGFGFKAMLGKISLGLEWSFRKTFTDDLDGIDNQYKTGNINDEPEQHPHPKGFQKGIFNTSDWYSFAGITISFRPGPKKNSCPTIN